MPEFYFTFGQKYRHETHPAGGHPDGWFTIEAKTEGEAREAMFALVGVRWAMCYDTPPDPRLYPMGELNRFKAPSRQ